MFRSVAAILFVIAFLIGFVLNPRTEKENGCQTAVLSFVFLMIALGAAAAICTLFGIPVNLTSSCIFLAVADIALFGRIAIKKCIAELEWHVSEIIGILCCVAVIIAAALYRFGPNLRLAYEDVDACRYLQGAMQILYDEQISGQYLTTWLQALVISVCKCFLPPISYYKGLILSHIITQTVCICMFYSIVSVINDSGRRQWLNVAVTVLFWGGFPLYNSTYGTFLQSMNGSVMVMLLIYYTVRLQKGTVGAVRGATALIAGCFGLFICYPFFALILFPMLLPEALIWLKNNLPSFSGRMRMYLAAGTFVAVAAGLFFAGQRIGNSLHILMSALQAEGLTYKNPYLDFIFFIPVLIFYTGMLLKKKEQQKTVLRMMVMAILFICVWFVLYVREYLSSYYYYRMYYILWMMAWLMAADALCLAIEKRKALPAAAYAVFYGMIIFISVFDLDERLWELKEDMYSEKSEAVLCPLYRSSYEALTQKPRTVLSDQAYQFYDYVMQHLTDEKVYAIHSTYSAMETDWFLGITYQGAMFANGSYNMQDMTLEKIFASLDMEGIDYILIHKSDPVCMRYYDEIFGKLDIVWENETGCIFSLKDGEWVDMIYSYKEKEPDLCQLYGHISGRYHASEIPLICETELEEEAFLYSMYAGLDATGYIGAISPDDFIASTYIFNLDEVEYMTVLKDSEMYQKNQEYFDAQIILSENDAGMVITHAGDGWMPSEQE